MNQKNQKKSTGKEYWKEALERKRNSEKNNRNGTEKEHWKGQLKGQLKILKVCDVNIGKTEKELEKYWKGRVERNTQKNTKINSGKEP